MASPLQPLCPKVQDAFCSKFKTFCSTFNINIESSCESSVNAIHGKCEEMLKQSESLDGHRLCPIIISQLHQLPPSMVSAATTACEDIVKNAALAWKNHETSASQDLCFTIENDLYSVLKTKI